MEGRRQGLMEKNDGGRKERGWRKEERECASGKEEVGRMEGGKRARRKEEWGRSKEEGKKMEEEGTGEGMGGGRRGV